MEIVMTGGSSGLGAAALSNFLNQGHKVILLARNPEKLNVKHDHLRVIKADLNSLQSIRHAANEIIKTQSSIDVLINNAGIWNFDFQESEDGIEQTFHLNVVAPIFLTQLLLPILKNAAHPKVITTASGLHQGSIHFEDIQYRNRFSGFKSYRQSKLCVIVWTRYMARKEKEVFWATQHPGLVDTKLVRSGSFFAQWFFRWFGKSPEKGAKTLVYLVNENIEKLKTGEFYKNEKVAKTDTLASYDLRNAPKIIEIVNQITKS